MNNILIVEDDISLSQGIALSLKEPGRSFVQRHDIAGAREALREGEYNLIILDIHLPDGSGLDFCREIRPIFSAPILFLTANDTELDMVLGLETGGDDYITKPFSLAVLRARVAALLRRQTSDTANVIRIDDFCFDFEAMHFTKRGEVIELSKTEQKLLYLLVSNRGQTLSRDVLLERIWPDGTEYVDENALSVAIRRLRSKIEAEPAHPAYIRTVYGIGYTWAVSP